MFGLGLGIGLGQNVAALGGGGGPAAASSLTDNFNDNSTDLAKWAVGQMKDPAAVTTGVTVAETGGREDVTPPGSGLLEYNGYVSVSTYTFTNDAIVVKITPASALSTAEEFYLAAGPDVSNHFMATQSGGSIYLQKMVAGANTNLGNFAYNSTTHAWIRLRHDSSGDTINVDTATSSASNPPVSGDWTNRISGARDVAIATTSNKLAFGAGSYTSGITPVTVSFDGFNIAP
jgi:hypothetical protein